MLSFIPSHFAGFQAILGIHADSVWGGVIGGITVCCGVVLAEWMT